MAKLKFLQMGGEMGPAEAPMGADQGMGGAPAPGGAEGGDPIVQLVEMAMQALQSQDPQMALAVCEGLVQLTQGGAPGGEAAPAGVPEEPVMMKKGGKIVAKKKKSKC